MMLPRGFETELIYSFIIIISSLMIYLGTKKLYDLTSYKGIKYFRQSFLFFAIAYFFRSLIKFILIFFNLGNLHSIRTLGPLTLVLFMYFSYLAVFYLIYSVIWKEFKSKIYILHLLALIFSITSIFLSNRNSYFYINIFLLVTIGVIFFSRHKRSNKLHAIYMLLFIFWFLNVIDILIPNFLQTFQLLIYLIST